jgi:hypothetical protein
LRRPARTIGANCPEAVLQKASVNRASFAKRVVHADDLVEPGSEQILLGLRRSVGRIPKDPLAFYDTTESSLWEFARSRRPKRQALANTNT